MKSASAPGKIILVGEHAIMYGGTAVAMAINKRLTVEIVSEKHSERNAYPEQTEKMIAHMANQYGVEVAGVNIKSEIPMGAGLGSSAALSVATCAALGGVPDLEVNSLKADGFFHGNPSGIDTGTSIRGGIVVKRGKAPCESLLLDMPAFLIVDTGIPHSTKQVNERLKERWSDNRLRFDQIVQELSQLAEDLISQTVPIENVFFEAQKLLTELGVVDEVTVGFTSHLRQLQIAAKITGAGMGGCVLVLHHDAELLQRIAKQHYGEKASVFPAIPDWEGVKIII